MRTLALLCIFYFAFPLYLNAQGWIPGVIPNKNSNESHNKNMSSPQKYLPDEKNTSCTDCEDNTGNNLKIYERQNIYTESEYEHRERREKMMNKIKKRNSEQEKFKEDVQRAMEENQKKWENLHRIFKMLN